MLPIGIFTDVLLLFRQYDEHVPHSDGLSSDMFVLEEIIVIQGEAEVQQVKKATLHNSR